MRRLKRILADCKRDVAALRLMFDVDNQDDRFNRFSCFTCIKYDKFTFIIKLKQLFVLRIIQLGQRNNSNWAHARSTEWHV